ncbi:hypothetical protein [Microbulbifer sp.]|uniref:hypothetical protein n=1 Tax=Microbulbifer sp. TaxID=1908541 RepID=UPI003F413DAE
MTVRLLTTAILALFSFQAACASALTMEQFSKICESSSGACSDHPVLQAYVGGALDLLATLDEETNYLEKLYCGEPKEVFDVPAIIRFMQEHGEQYDTRNAMLLLVRYFEKNGGCRP